MMHWFGQIDRSGRGSALILTVVLTSLLAIVGVLFVMSARIDKMATSAASDSRDLDSALETVVAQINEMLVVDVPGVTDDQEYYDYPDAENAWLADLEPYESGTEEYSWRQISNVAGLPLAGTTDVLIDVVGEREPIDVNATAANADADGDGVGDARWFLVPGIVSSRGKPVYGAVRIVDNGAMLNLNTGYEFDKTHGDQTRVSGASMLHVNVMALAAGPGDVPALGDETELLSTRANYTATPAGIDLPEYERLVTWRYLDVLRGPDANGYTYTPFDMSDELELRYRYLLNHATQTRVEEWGRLSTSKWAPVDYRGDDLDKWFRYAAGGGLDPNYAYRHIATTYNMDRVFTPRPVATTLGRDIRKKRNVNATSVQDLAAMRDVIAEALREADPTAAELDISERATQIAVNLRDFVDDDDEVTAMPSSATQEFIGFERPCLYISEVACRWVREDTQIHKSYAIELYKPYFEDAPPDPEFSEWRLLVNNVVADRFDETILWSGTRRFHVLMTENPKAPLRPRIAWEAEPADSMPLYGYRSDDYPRSAQDLNSAGFEEGATIYLERYVEGKWKQVDSVTVPTGWMAADGKVRSLQRDVSAHKCIWRLWSPPAERLDASLGNKNLYYIDPDHTDIVQAHPKNDKLTNIGEIGMVFATSGYYVPEDAAPADILIDLANPKYSRLFNYLTVMDPSDHGRGDEETRIMGRINVNTAPWLVLAQLPWIQYPGDTYDRALAIVADRLARGPFHSVGDLMRVPELALPPDQSDNLHEDSPRGPDLTRDTARNDYEERDLIFARISNLVTVRSDVFTAYVLVRIGLDGPQRRLIAILDRSDVEGPDDCVRVLARHLVPDPR